MLTASGSLLLPYSRAAVTVYQAPTLVFRTQTAARSLLYKAQCASNRVGTRYAKLSTDRPYITAAFTGSTILSAADITSQSLESMNSGRAMCWNARRTLALAVFGFLYYGGPLKFAYLTYDKVFKCAIKKTVFDVVIHTPLCMIPSFFMITGVMKGKGVAKSYEQLKDQWRSSSVGSVAFWGPTCAFNFSVVPAHSRVLVLASMSFFHKIWLSWMTNGQPSTEEEGTRATHSRQSDDKETQLNNFEGDMGINKTSVRYQMTVPDPCIHIPVAATVDATIFMSVQLYSLYEALFNCIVRTIKHNREALYWSREGANYAISCLMKKYGYY